jgi:uncharacterized protein involved in response to NO
MTRTAETQRAWKGLALLSRGFRPFFLFAGLWALVAVLVWPPFFTGAIAMPTAFSAVDWHAHEMLFGYGAAVIAGFLLTAIPNWTGRLPVAGWPLALLSLLWLAGRVAVFASGVIGWPAAAAIDTLFLLVFAAVAAREIIAGHNRRNLKVVVLVSVLALVNLCFHWRSAVTGSAADAAHAGLALIVFLILLIGGRVVPSFTHNWLAKQGQAGRPVAVSRPDAIVMALSGVALASWIVWPEAMAVGLGLVTAGLANLWRLSRWHGWRARADRLVLILHVGFLFAALGFLLAGGHALVPDLVPAAAGIHTWAIGAIGTMTLAMMTRATLGHSARGLTASRGTRAVYLAVILATLVRVAAALFPAYTVPLIYAAALLWCLGFLGFLVIYGPLLALPAAPPAPSPGPRPRLTIAEPRH